MMLAANFLTSVIGITKMYPIISPFVAFFVPWDVVRSLPTLIRDLRKGVKIRMEQRANPKHPDYFEHLLPADKPAPTSQQQIRHIRTLAGQFILGGFDPTSTLLYMTIFFLLQNPKALEILVTEIRSSFRSYDEIQPDACAKLHYLNACMQETLRLNATATHHSLPRISPGGIVNGSFIPKGVSDVFMDSKRLIICR
jgi:cytochrome P450